MTATIIRSDARAIPLPDASVDLIVTSPPYFALRSYTDGGEHYDGQIGAEPTPREYIASLIACTREWVRVLKPGGSLFVNLGDKYAGGGGQWEKDDRVDALRAGRRVASNRGATYGMRSKSLMMLPERYRIAAVDELGLIARAVIVWSKPNGLPESVTDRVRRSHEDWVHLTKAPRYFSAVDEIREAYAPGTAERYRSGYGPNTRAQNGAMKGSAGTVFNGDTFGTNPLGKLPGSVWVDQHVSDDSDLIRSILGAVAAGAITAEEGERLWTGQSISCATSTSPKTGAGNGPGTGSQPDTARSPSSAPGGKTSPTGSATGSSSDPSPTDSPSTTCAGTPDASDPITSSQSPSARTSAEPSPSAPSASTGIHSPTPTSTSRPPASRTRSAGPASSPGSDVGESVWQVATEPLKVPPHLGVDHFAAFPSELPRRLILGWSPSGICTACGEGRRPVVASVGLDMNRPQARRAQELADRAQLTEAHFAALLSVGVSDTGRGAATQSGTGKNTPEVYALAAEARAVLGGYAREYLLRRPTGYRDACACPDTSAPTRPSVVLDPFGGTGTTALVASVLGRHGISVDMSADYCRLARWRTSDPGQRAKAARVEKPPVQLEGQGSLFEVAS